MNFYFWIISLTLLTGAAFVVGVPEFLLMALAMVLPVVLSLIPGISDNWLLQLGALLVSGVFFFLFLRGRFRKLFCGEEIQDDRSGDSGVEVEVVEAVAPDNPGRIQFHGTTWPAISLDAAFVPGDRAVILEKNGLHYTIGKWNKEEVWNLPSSD